MPLFAILANKTTSNQKEKRKKSYILAIWRNSFINDPFITVRATPQIEY